MPGTNDRNDLSGEGAVQLGKLPSLCFCSGGLPLQAPIAAVARSTGRYPPCNKMYHIEDYREERPVIAPRQAVRLTLGYPPFVRLLSNRKQGRQHTNKG